MIDGSGKSGCHPGRSSLITADVQMPARPGLVAVWRDVKPLIVQVRSKGWQLTVTSKRSHPPLPELPSTSTETGSGGVQVMRRYCIEMRPFPGGAICTEQDIQYGSLPR